MNINAVRGYANYSSKVRQTTFNSAESLSNNSFGNKAGIDLITEDDVIANLGLRSPKISFDEAKKIIAEDIIPKLDSMRSEALHKINLGFQQRNTYQVNQGLDIISINVDFIKKALEQIIQ